MPCSPSQLRAFFMVSQFLMPKIVTALVLAIPASLLTLLDGNAPLSNCKFVLRNVAARNSPNLFALIADEGGGCVTRCRHAPQAPHIRHASPAPPSGAMPGPSRATILCADQSAADLAGCRRTQG